MAFVLEEARKAWVKASSFPIDKEQHYPEHGGVQEFDLHSDRRVLEYGCGSGSDTLSFLRRGNKVWYCDIVLQNICAAANNIARAKLSKNAHAVILNNSIPLPLPGDFFDIVSSHGVVHHIPEPQLVVAEFYRVLRSNGLLYIMLYTEVFWEHFLPDMRILVESGADQFKAFSECTDPGTPYARCYTEEEGRSLLSASGFVVDKVSTWNDEFFRTFRARKL